MIPRTIFSIPCLVDPIFNFLVLFDTLQIKENQVSFLDQKKQFYEKDVTRYDTELERISNNISTLSNKTITLLLKLLFSLKT